MKPDTLRPHSLPKQRGAAILLAMLIVTLVASLSAAALWQQWRSVTLESAERARLQSAWILQGALDWARLILREDARNGGADHLAEPWAVPLQEARLSSFLAADSGSAQDSAALDDVFLSGEITDLQSRLNVRYLVDDQGVHTPTVQAFTRLFEALQLPADQVQPLARRLHQALKPPTDDDANADAPLLPTTMAQLAWLGLSPVVIEAITPYVVVLPQRTTVNINTASALVLHAAVPGLGLGDAQTWLSARARAHFRSLTDAPAPRDTSLNDAQLSISSRFFSIRAQLRRGAHVLEEVSQVQRDALTTKVLARDRRPATRAAPQQSS